MLNTLFEALCRLPSTGLPSTGGCGLERRCIRGIPARTPEGETKGEVLTQNFGYAARLRQNRFWGPKKIWRAAGAPEKIVFLIILPLEIAIFESKTYFFSRH